MAIGRSKVKIWIVNADTDPSQLVQTGSFDGNNYSPILGQISDYSKTGGENDVETVPLFGGFADKEKPQSQFEMSFDIVPSLEKEHIFNEMAYTLDATNGVLVSGGSLSGKSVFVQNSGTSGTYTSGYGINNCSVVVLDMEHSADDNQTKTLNLKFSPTNEDNIPNFMFNSTSRDATFTDIGDLPSWTSLIQAN